MSQCGNKAVYTALGAPKHLDKRTRYGPTDRRTDGWTDGQTVLQRCFVAPKNRLIRLRCRAHNVADQLNDNMHAYTQPCTHQIAKKARIIIFLEIRVRKHDEFGFIFSAYPKNVFEDPFLPKILGQIFTEIEILIQGALRSMRPGVLANSRRNSLRGQDALENAYQWDTSFAFRFSDGRPSYSIPLH